MPYREFDDDEGRHWEAWDVQPASVEHSLNSAERAPAADEPERPVRVNLPVDLSAGWLAFQCATDSRRLAPIPANWVAMSPAELVTLVRRAKPVPRHPRPPLGRPRAERPIIDETRP